MAIYINNNHLIHKNTFVEIAESCVVDDTINRSAILEFNVPCADEKLIFVAINSTGFMPTIEFVAADDYTGKPMEVISIPPNCQMAAVVDSKFVRDSNGNIRIKITPEEDCTLTECLVRFYVLYQGVETK